MRKLYLLVTLFMFALSTFSQNLQLHYDFGDGRKMITSTVEMFKPDNYGSTFFFIDMDYGSEASGVDGISLAYWEIARSMRFLKDMPALEARAEYNGGFGRNTFGGYGISQAWLAGAQYTLNNEDFSKVLTIQANYKYIIDNVGSSFQITAVWGLHFFDRKLSFTGFADFWKEDVDFDFDGTTDAEYIFLTEPQIWYNINKTFSVGSEIEISNNFAANDGFMVNPTVAAKWTF